MRDCFGCGWQGLRIRSGDERNGPGRAIGLPSGQEQGGHEGIEGVDRDAVRRASCGTELEFRPCAAVLAQSLGEVDCWSQPMQHALLLLYRLTKRSSPKYSNTRKEIRMSNQQQPQPTLYERLGGAFSVATVVDDLIDRVMTDARLMRTPPWTKPTTRRRQPASSITSPKWFAGRPVARRNTRGAPCATLIST